MATPSTRHDAPRADLSASRPIPRAQAIAERALARVEHFLHIEAVGGAVLVVAAAIALIWANSPWAASYEHLWHLPVSLGIGELRLSQSLHFIINDGLMTIFFLVVGLEIRREMHEGALKDVRQAMLPIAAAAGGVIVPALIYVAMNPSGEALRGWAVPTATDIAFAVGVLALLGKRVPSNLRIFLLTLAIIDDVIAVLIIAFFYSGGLNPVGFAVIALGVAMVLACQRIGLGSAFAYVIPGAVVWGGLLMTGAHPTLAGVLLGLLTPVVARASREAPVDAILRVAGLIQENDGRISVDEAAGPARDLRRAQRDLTPPVVRVQQVLHPWVAFVIMPLFALANAGVAVGGVTFAGGATSVLLGVALALVVGKLVGVVGVTWIMVRLRLCALPAGVDWSGVVLVGLLAGIGFTMSIFVAMLAFTDANLLASAKLGVLAGSVTAAILGLAWGAARLKGARGEA